MVFEPVSASLLASGIVLHQITSLAKKSKEEGKPVHFINHYKERPYASLATLGLSVVGYVLLGDMGQLSNFTAFTMGYAGNSVGNSVTELAKRGGNVGDST